MKKTGKWLCAILAFCMILGIFSESVIAANASPFEDVLPKDWFYSDVQDVCKRGLMNGTDENRFSPEERTTRAMIVTILWRMEKQPVNEYDGFVDVAPAAYYADAVTWAAYNQIVSGYGEGKFGPADPITREQLAVILFRYLQYKKMQPDRADENVLNDFADQNQIGSYARTAVCWAVEAGILRGSTRLLNPQGTATRAQVAAILSRFCKLYEIQEDSRIDATAPSAPVAPPNPSENPDIPTQPEESEKCFEITFNETSVMIRNPVEENGCLYLPLQDMLELFGYEYFWVEEYQTIVALRNGTVLRLYIGSEEVEEQGTKKTIPTAPVVRNGIPMIAANCLESLFDCKAIWQLSPMTLSVTGTVPPLIDYYVADSFGELGTWKRDGVYLQGTSVADAETRPAVLEVLVKASGTYRLWVNARDFSTNQPGTRYFNVAVDGIESQTTFGQHGGDGFKWTDGGTFELEKGIHKIALLDTSRFYARCSGILLSQELDFQPYDDEQMADTVVPYDPFAPLVTPVFPEWAKKDIPATETLELVNDAGKVVFYEGTSEESGNSLVQNEIYIKHEGKWIKVKEKTEELGYLMLDASDSQYVGVESEIVSNLQTFELGGKTVSMATKNFYKSGNSTWFIPSGMELVNDDTVKLIFAHNQKADVEVLFSLPEDAQDPKVTLNASFHHDGAYSFLLSSGDAVEYDAFERVTAPLLYVKKAFPKGIGSVTAECYMFTPMSTFTYSDTQVGTKRTSGLVVDPEEITMEDNYSYPDTSKFGFTFQTTDGKYRNQLVAPMFGTEHCKFKAGETASISFRIVNRLEDWFDTYQYITQNMYNLSDVRTNWNSSINEAIYNATDLMMYDDYGGWDENAMSFYNMENKDLVTTGNPMAIVQRYLLTENEEWLEKRAIPTLAYALSRPSYHCLPTKENGGVYVPAGGPTDVGSPMVQFGTNVYGGLYEMTQGRVPYLLDYAVKNVKVEENLSGINSMIAMYKYTGQELYKNKLIELADQYLQTNPLKRMNVAFVDGFVYGDYISTATAFTNAYECTGKQEYLEAAKQSAQMLMTSLWTTGYQGERLTTNYTIDPDATMQRLLHCDENNAKFWYHGDKVWRLGNVDGEAKKPQDLPLKIPAETVPAWLLAKAGMGTEHTRTPGAGDVITMNVWAGTLERLAKYTNEPYFEMQARNAMLGRFGNYPGYYQDRNIVHQMAATYPYTGPDYTLIYWHHIPVFVTMLEDYLINSVWSKSNGKIEFPSVHQDGYAYFATSQYGQAAGKFYDQTDMWLWLDRGIVNVKDVNLDYIAARKDGVLGLAFVNEANAETTAEISLGEKVPGGSSYTGDATLYAADGSKSVCKVKNGKFTLTIPAKELCAVVLNLDGIKKPVYARTYSYSNTLGNTYVEHENARAHVLQMTDDSYYAYVYTTLKEDAIIGLTVEYAYGDVTGTVEDAQYPFEAIIKVLDSSQEIKYKLTVKKSDGTTESIGEGTLKASVVGSGVSVPGSTEDACKPRVDFSNQEAFKVPVISSGSTGHDVRFVTNKADYPERIQENFGANVLAGMKIYAVLRDKATGTVKIMDTVVQANSVRVQNGISQTIIVCDETDSVPAGDYRGYTIELAMCGAQVETNLSSLFDLEEQVYPFQMKLLEQNRTDDDIEFSVLKKACFSNTKESDLVGISLQIEWKNESGEEKKALTPILAATIGSDRVTLKVAGDAIPNGISVERLALKPVLTPQVVTTGVTTQLKIVTDNQSYCLMPDITQLVGFKMYAGFVNKTTGEAVYVDAIIRGAERRAYDGNVTLTVDAPAGSTLSELSGWTTKTHLMAIALAEADNTADLKAIVDGALNEASPSKEPIQLTLKGQGSGVDSGSAVFRFVVAKKEISDYAEAGKMNGMWLEAVFMPKSGSGDTLRLTGRIIRNEDHSNVENTVLIMPGTGAVPAAVYNDRYQIALTLHPEYDDTAVDKRSFPATDLYLVKMGQGASGEEFRLVTAKNHVPFAPDAGSMNGMKLTVIFTPKSGGTTKTLSGEIIRNEDRPNEPNNTTIVMAQTADVPYESVDCTNYSVRMILEPAED